MLELKTPEVAYASNAVSTNTKANKTKKNKSLPATILEAGLVISFVYATGMLIEAVYRFICAC